jgi:predicted RNase H-like HicB family nuclease
MTKRYLISVEPIEPSGVVLTIAELPGLVIFGQTAEDALGWAREAIAFQLRDSPDFDQKAAARVGTRPGELTIFGTCVARRWRGEVVSRPRLAASLRRYPCVGSKVTDVTEPPAPYVELGLAALR